MWAGRFRDDDVEVDLVGRNWVWGGGGVVRRASSDGMVSVKRTSQTRFHGFIDIGVGRERESGRSQFAVPVFTVGNGGTRETGVRCQVQVVC